jgi:hypothetical protein
MRTVTAIPFAYSVLRRDDESHKPSVSYHPHNPSPIDRLYHFYIGTANKNAPDNNTHASA